MPTALVMEVIRLLLQNQPFFKGKDRRLDRSMIGFFRVWSANARRSQSSTEPETKV